MKVTDLIKALKQAKCWKDGTVSFWYGDIELDITSMSESQFDLTDIIIKLEEQEK